MPGEFPDVVVTVAFAKLRIAALSVNRPGASEPVVSTGVPSALIEPRVDA
jgi:hypothetical protein